MRVLVVNPGSSSLKLSVLSHDDATVAEADLDGSEGPGQAALRDFLASAPACDAVGVRVVHGGPRFRAPVVADDDVVRQLDDLAALAPLHNPPAVRAIRTLLAWGRAPVVACFDTAFHATLAAAATTYAVPRSWTEGLGIRRYGFHGLSCAYAARRAPAVLAREAAGLGMVICHLGAGSSLTAVQGGRSVDTTMGFTPMEGLVMATRSGSLDPGALLFAQRSLGLDPDATERLLDRESGLLGLSGISGDIRPVLAAADGGDARARLAIDVFVHRLRAAVGAMAVALDRLDAIVFTGGIGENSGTIRRAACAGLGTLGLEPLADEDEGDDDRVLSAPGAPVAVLAIHAREDLQIAHEVRRLVAGAGQDATGDAA